MKTITKTLLVAVLVSAILFLTTFIASAQFPFSLGTPGGTAITSGGGIATDAAGNVYITGFFSGATNFNPSGSNIMTPAGTSDQYVAKYDASGLFQWSLHIKDGLTGTAGQGNGAGTSLKGIAVDASGDVYVEGTFNGSATFYDVNNTATAPVSGGVSATLTGIGGNDVFVAEYNTSGVLQWRFKFGGTGSDIGIDLAADASNNVDFTGSFGGAGLTATFYGINDVSSGHTLVSGTGSGTDVFVAQYNNAGTYSWSLKGVGTTAQRTNAGLGIATDASSNVFVSGSYGGTLSTSNLTFTDAAANTKALGTSQSIGTDAFIAEFNSSGILQWAGKMSSGSIDAGNGIATDHASPANVYIVIHLGASPIKIYDETSTSTPISTFTCPSSSGSGNDAFVVKFNSTGNFQYDIDMGGSSGDAGYGIATDPSNNVLVTGSFQTAMTFNNEDASVGGTVSNNGSTNADYFIAKYNSSGFYQWGLSAISNNGTSGTNYGSRLATDACGNVMVTGVFASGTETFWDAANDSLGSVTAQGAQDAFFVRYGANGVALITKQPATPTYFCTGGNATFSVTAPGASTYQWQESTNGGSTWNNITTAGGGNPTYGGYTTASLTFTNLPGTYAGNTYRCVIGVGACPLVSSIAELAQLSITSQPVSNTAFCSGPGGGTATFTVAAGGVGTLTYQWQESTGGPYSNTTNGLAMNGATYSGSTTTTLSISNPPYSMNGNTYRCVVTSAACGTSVNSNGLATLTLLPIPTFSAQPQPTSVCVGGGPVSFSVTSATAISFQWYQSQTAGGNAATTSAQFLADGFSTDPSTSGANSSATITLTDFTDNADNGYNYAVQATDANGCSSFSGQATLTVNISPAPVATAGTSITNSSFTANWNAVAGATGYFLDVATDNGFVNILAGYNNLSVSGTSQPVTGLIGGTTYYYQVRNNNICGVSSNSNAIAVTLPCSAPVTGTAIAAGGTGSAPNTVICNGTTTTITLTNYGGTIQWQSSADGETSWASVAGGSGATSATYTTATLATTTYFRALVTNNCFSVASNTVIVYISAAPTVTLTNVTPTSVSASWTPFALNSNVAYTLTCTGASTQVFSPAGNNPQTITVTSGSALNVTVAQTNPAGCAVSGNASINTQLAAPTLTLSAATARGFTASWNSVTGASSYTLYYRVVGGNGGNSTLTTALTTATLNGLYGDAIYLVYVVANEAGYTGAVSTEEYISTLPGTSTCATPTITNLSSPCANEISVMMSGSPSNIYRVTFTRLSPNPSAGASYNVTGGAVNITIGVQYANSFWQVLVASNCSGVSSEIANPQYIFIKAACPQLQNLVLSTPTCRGFEATWNPGTCTSPENYYIYIQKQGAVSWNAYPVGINNYVDVDWIPATTWNAIVEQLGCNGAASTYSAVQTITTGVGCRTEEEEVQTDNSTSTNVEQVNAAMDIYPNPSNGNFMVNVYTKNKPDEMVQIEMVNTLGQVVFTVIAPVTNGISNNTFQVPANVASGMYIIRTVAGGENLTKEVLFTR